MIENSFTTNNLNHLDHRVTKQRKRVISLVGYIIKIENLPTFSGQKNDLVIGFNEVGLAVNTLWVINLNNF